MRAWHVSPARAAEGLRRGGSAVPAPTPSRPGLAGGGLPVETLFTCSKIKGWQSWVRSPINLTFRVVETIK